MSRCGNHGADRINYCFVFPRGHARFQWVGKKVGRTRPRLAVPQRQVRMVRKMSSDLHVGDQQLPNYVFCMRHYQS